MSSQSFEGLGEGRAFVLFAYLINVWGGEGNIFAATHFAPCNRELRVRGDRIMASPLKPSLFAQNSSWNASIFAFS